MFLPKPWLIGCLSCSLASSVIFFPCLRPDLLKRCCRYLRAHWSCQVLQTRAAVVHISWTPAKDRAFTIRFTLAFIQRLLERACPSWDDHELDPSDTAVQIFNWRRSKQVTVKILVCGHLLNVK